MNTHEEMWKKYSSLIDQDAGFYPEELPKEFIELGKEIGRDISSPVVQRGEQLKKKVVKWKRAQWYKAIVDRLVDLSETDPEMGIKEALDKRKEIRGIVKDKLSESEELNEHYNEFAGSALSLKLVFADKLAQKGGYRDYRDLDNQSTFNLSKGEQK
jgi:hypothetical protein